jgi:hypothetical protein
MRTIAAAGLVALTAMLGVAASIAVAGPATAGQRPTTAPPAKAVKPPANQLYGVSCASANDCVAVGVNANAADTGKRGGALIQTWNGTTWTSVAPKAPKGAVTAACIAVGTSGSDTAEFALADAWNGKTWTATRVPAPGKGQAGLFSEVSCPAAFGCVAVGQLGPYNSDEGSGLAGFWNGRSWKLGTTP